MVTQPITLASLTKDYLALDQERECAKRWDPITQEIYEHDPEYQRYHSAEMQLVSMADELEAAGHIEPTMVTMQAAISVIDHQIEMLDPNGPDYAAALDAARQAKVQREHERSLMGEL